MRCASALSDGHLRGGQRRRPAGAHAPCSASTRISSIRRSPSVQVTIASAISGVLWNQRNSRIPPGMSSVVAAALAQAAAAAWRDPAASAAWPRDAIAVADRNRQRLEEAGVVLLAMVLGVGDQVQLRVLLALRVEAFTGDVGADGRHQVDADHRDQQLQADDAGEDGQYRPGPPAGALALPAHAARRCRRKRAGQASDFPGKDMARGYGKNPRRDKRLRPAPRRASQSAPMFKPT